MIGVITNVIAIIVGGLIGLAGRKVIPVGWNDIIMKGLGMASIYIGVDGALSGENTLSVIICIVIGSMIGEGFKIEQRFNGFAERTEKKLDARGSKSNFAQSFITASLMMCVGAMVVVGSLNAGLKGDLSLLLTKSALDFVGGIMFVSAMGYGAIFAAVPTLIIEGFLVLLAGVVAPILPTDVINEMTCIGSILIIAMGLNLTVDAKLKIMNYMPAVFLPIVFVPVYNWVAGML